MLPKIPMDRQPRVRNNDIILYSIEFEPDGAVTRDRVKRGQSYATRAQRRYPELREHVIISDLLNF